ncbi:MAG: PRC-barrel domain-containing protein [Sphingobium sp.]
MATNAELPAAGPFQARALISADDVRGKTVYGRDGDKLGTIDKLILDERTGQVAYIILSTGGFLGLGQSYHPVPWSAFRYDETQGGYAAAIDKRLLEGAPSFRPDSAPVFDEAYGQRVTDYFGLPPAVTS